MSFSRRSDVEDDIAQGDEDRIDGSVTDKPLMGAENRKVIHLFTRPNATNDGTEQQELLMNIRAPESVAQESSSGEIEKQEASSRTRLTCFDVLTNRTYQQSEIIKKDDPCKTCTCVLGEELCQIMVCPPRPNVDCREERQEGRCCSTYLCGGRTENSSSEHGLSNQVDKKQPTPGVTGNVTDQLLPAGNGAILQSARMIHNPSDVANQHLASTNNVSMHQRNLIASKPESTRAQPERLDLRLISQQDRQQQQHQKLLQQQQLPTTPVVPISPNFLPPHLSFRPSTHDGPNYLILKQAEQMNRFRFPLSNAQMSSEGNLLHVPRIDAMQGSSDVSKMRPYLSQSQSIPFVGPKWRNEFGSMNINNPFDPSHRPSNPILPSANRAIPNLLRHQLLREQQNTAAPTATREGNAANSNEVRRSDKETSASLNLPQTSVNNPPPMQNYIQKSGLLSPQSQPITFQGSTYGWLPNGGLIPRDQLMHRKPPTQTRIDSNPTSTKDRVLFQHAHESSFSTADTLPQLSQQNTGFVPIIPVPELYQARAQNSQKLDLTVTVPPNRSQPQAAKSDDIPVVAIEPNSDSHVVTVLQTGNPMATSTIIATSTTTAATTTSGPQVDPTSMSDQISHLADEHISHDPVGLLQVSECNIYGKLYKVGEEIVELSDSCKYCSCNATGVVCQQKCSKRETAQSSE